MAKKAKKSAKNSAINRTVANLEKQLQAVQKRLEGAMDSSERAVRAARRRAADAALHWVMAHEARVASFRKSVKGTPAQKVLDKLLALIRSEARGPAKARRKAPRKAAATAG